MPATSTAAARGAMDEAAAARAFCDFLELRVLTRNLSLLRRMLDEHFRGDGDQRMVRDFVQLGATLVVVKPFDVRDRERRRQAAELLEYQRQQTAALEAANSPVAPATPWRSVRERERRCCAWLLHLGARVQTRNLAWLRDMLAQFLLGQEQRLVEFVRAGSYVVSFLPVDADPSGVGAASSDPTSSEIPVGGSSGVVGLGDEETGSVARNAGGDGSRRAELGLRPKKRIRTDKGPSDGPHELSSRVSRYNGAKRRGGRDNGGGDRGPHNIEEPGGGSESGGESGDLSDSDGDGGMGATRSQGKPKRRGRRRQFDDDGTRGDVDGASASDEPWRQAQEEVLAMFDEVEAREPWKRVFHDKLALPFDEDGYPELATALRRFWAAHSRAVWERNFWAPLTRRYESTRMEKRKRRQGLAVRSFELTVVEPAVNQLGASFFLELDRCVSRVEGWWYRKEVVDLFTMCRQANGSQAVREYLDTQAMKRFPRSGKLGRRYHYDGNGVSESMWSCNQALETVVAEIRTMKQGVQRHHRRPQRRRAEDDKVAEPDSSERGPKEDHDSCEGRYSRARPDPDEDAHDKRKEEEAGRAGSGHDEDGDELLDASGSSDSGYDDDDAEVRNAGADGREHGDGGLVDLTVDGSDDAGACGSGDWHTDADGVIVMDEEAEGS